MPVHVQSQIPLQNPQHELCDEGHSIFKSSCSACKTLKKEWYTYLNKTGFEDIERGLNLVSSTQDLALRNAFKSQDLFNAKRDYYQWAQECLTMCSFDSQIDKIIWEYHSEGYSRREIAPVVGFHNSHISNRLKLIKTKLKNK